MDIVDALHPEPQHSVWAEPNSPEQFTTRSVHGFSDDEEEKGSSDEEHYDGRPLLNGKTGGDELLSRHWEEEEQAFTKSKRRLCLGRPLRTILWQSILALFLLLLIIAAILSRRPSHPRPGPHWTGFHKIENWFSFGDCWTSIDAVYVPNELKRPMPSNFPGFTRSGDPTYMYYLTLEYNLSQFNAWNLAMGGSVVDGRHEPNFGKDFYRQFHDDFIVNYTTSETNSSLVPINLNRSNRTSAPTVLPKNWSTNTTLFSTFFGINDLLLPYYSGGVFNITAVIDSYEDLYASLYNLSARNFLLINAPALYLSPTERDSVFLKQNVRYYNWALSDMATRLRARYKDITLFEFDLQAWFTEVYSSIDAMPETAGIEILDRACFGYVLLKPGHRATREDVFNCGGFTPEQYFWKDGSHVMQPVHRGMARAIRRLLVSEGRRYVLPVGGYEKDE